MTTLAGLTETPWHHWHHDDTSHPFGFRTGT
jgi:hypothetical protein